MAYTQPFRDQQDDLISRSDEISKQLVEAYLKNDASLVRDMISSLLVKIEIHLTVEEKALYPQLINSGNDKVSVVAKHFQKDGKNLAHLVTNYEGNWKSALAISENPKKFIEETHQLLSLLSERIQKESNHLYKLADDYL